MDNMNLISPEIQKAWEKFSEDADFFFKHRVISIRKGMLKFLFLDCSLKFTQMMFWMLRRFIDVQKHYLILKIITPYSVWSSYLILLWVRTGLKVQFSSVVQSCPTLCDPMNHITPGLPVHHQLLEFTQTHVSDAIQPSHPLSSPSLPAPNPSQHQSFPMSQLFTWGGQSTGVSASASFLPKNTQGWSLEWTGWISLQSKGLLRVFQHHSSKASILWHSAFFTVQLSHPYMSTGKTIALIRWTFVGNVSTFQYAI